MEVHKDVFVVLIADGTMTRGKALSGQLVQQTKPTVPVKASQFSSI